MSDYPRPLPYRCTLITACGATRELIVRGRPQPDIRIPIYDRRLSFKYPVEPTGPSANVRVFGLVEVDNHNLTAIYRESL